MAIGFVALCVVLFASDVALVHSSRGFHNGRVSGIAFPKVSRGLKGVNALEKWADAFLGEEMEDDSSSSSAALTEGVFVGQIVGGTHAHVDRYPFMCSLRNRSSKRHFCGCALIAPHVVLTAAHCVDKRSKDYSRPLVHVGRYYRSQKDSDHDTFATGDMHLHPKWNPSSNDYDLALLFLDKKSTYHPISLTDDQGGMQPRTAVTVLGWGRTSEGGDASEALLEVTLPTMTASACRNAYGSKMKDSMFCAGLPEGGSDACQGDSGGPVILKKRRGSDVLVGVVSWGHGCARKGKPGVYTDVGHSKEWIGEMLKRKGGSGVISSAKRSSCTCSSNGWSGGVKTPRIGCARHLEQHGDGDHFCMVKEGLKCPTAIASKAYSGASWMLCEPEEEESNPSAEEENESTATEQETERKRRGFKVKLGPLALHIKFGDRDDDDEESSFVDPCSCSVDGTSGSVKTKFKSDISHLHWRAIG